MTSKHEIVKIQYLKDQLSGEHLDDFLHKGWFRSSNTMYRTTLICKDDNLLSIKNVRLSIKDYQPKKRLRKIIRKNVERFRTVVRPLLLTQEKEALYHQHSNRYTGYVFESLEMYLNAKQEEKVFESFEVSVYEQDKLVAFSIFDLGETSLASIIGVYDQNYSRYSLGLYTMLCEVIYAKDRNMLYYYPGYVFHKASEFDYKLRLGEYEYLDSNNHWVPLSLSSQETWLSETIDRIIKALQHALEIDGLHHKLYFYPLFSFGYLEQFEDFGFVKEPVILQLFEKELPKLVESKIADTNNFFVSYSPDQKVYKLFVSEPSLIFNDFPEIDYGGKEVLYQSDPLCYHMILHETKDLEDMIRVINYYR